MAINFAGNLYDDSGAAIQGATVQLIGSDGVQEGSSVDTSVGTGAWSFSTSTEDEYDVKITHGSSIRHIRWSDQISLKELDVRNSTGATTPAATFTNLQNSTSNQVAVFSGANTTRADGDVIYLSYKLANSAGELTEFARMIVEAEDTYNGSEDGAIRFQVMRDGTLATVWEVKSTGDGDVNAPTMSFDLNMDSLSIGNGADTDIVLTFDANSADGVITWMEDEDYFKFSDDILMNSDEKILFGDAGTFIHQSADGVLTITSDTTVDINGAVVFDGALSGITTIASGAITSTGIVTGTGFTAGSAVLAEAELELLDGLTAGTAIASKVVTTDANIDTSGQRNLTITGGLDAATLDLSSSADIAGDLVLSGGADGALRFTNAGENSIKIPDNQASALIIEEADNAYITFVTTNSSEAITVAKATTFSAGIADSGTIAAGTWNGTDVGVAYGGTGASSLTDGGVLLGSGTGAVTAMAVLANSEMIVGDGTTDPVAESGATLRTSIGVGTGDSPQFTGIELGHATDTTIARASSGAITVEGTAVLLAGAQTGITTILNASTKIGRDSENLIDFATTDNTIILRVNNVNEVELVADALEPVTNDGVALGTTSLGWKDLHLATGGVINWANGEMTITEGDANTLTVAGGTFATAALTTSTIVASGIVKTDDGTDASSTADGSLQTDGGLSVVKDAVLGNDVKLLSDSAVLSFGADAEASITHADDAGLTFNSDITMAADKSLNLPQGANIKFTDPITQDSIDNDDAQGIIMTFTAGSTIRQYSPVYLHTDDEVHEADADGIATMPCIGVSINTSDVTDGNSVEVMILGLIRNEDWTDFGTNGAPVYVSTTVGTMTNTAPSGTDDVVQVIGHSIGEKLLFVQPCLTTIEHA